MGRRQYLRCFGRRPDSARSRQLAKIDTNGNNVTFARACERTGRTDEVWPRHPDLDGLEQLHGRHDGRRWHAAGGQYGRLARLHGPRQHRRQPRRALAVTAGTIAGEFSLTPGGGVDTVLLTGNVYFAERNLGTQRQ